MGRDKEPLSVFMYALRAPETKRQYPRRLKVFFDFLKLKDGLKDQAMEFLTEARKDKFRTEESLMKQQIDSVTNKNGPLVMRLNFCLDNQLISFMRRKSTSPGDILITNDILKDFRDTGIDFIQTFTDLGRMLGAEIKTTKVDRKSARPIILSVVKLIGFIDPEPS